MLLKGVRRVVVLPVPMAEADSTAVRQMVAQLCQSPKKRTKENTEKEKASLSSLQAVANILFADSLAETLRERVRLAVVPDMEMRSILTGMELSPADTLTPAQIVALCRKLNADVLFRPKVIQFQVREKTVRDVALYAEVETWRVSAVEKPYRVFASGGATTGRQLFREGFGQTVPRLAQEAARRAAHIAAFSLRTGEVVPLSREAERLAILPVAAPISADKLRFTPQGRKVTTAALSGLAADVSGRFLPDLLPLASDSVPDGQSVRREMNRLHLDANRFWLDSYRPHTENLRKLGTALKVDYLLLARASDLSLEAGPPSPKSFTAGGSGSQTEIVETEARAEAVGTLVRVSDGAILWQSRATATMTDRGQPAKSGEEARDRRLCENAVQFALLQLQRQWRSWRNH